MREKPSSAFAVDVRDSGSVKAMVRTALEGFSHIDVLINNAGIYPNSPMFELAESEWDDVFDINVKGVFLVAREVAAVMVDQGTKGRIINISSGAAISARPGAAHYCTSKAAVNMLTKVLALELAPHGITVNAIVPGPTIPGMFSSAPVEFQQMAAASSPFARLGTPSDIAAVVSFLAGTDSAWVTGQSILVNGGAAA